MKLNYEAFTSPNAMEILLILIFATGLILSGTDTAAGEFLRDYARFIWGK
jgi:hypothetical protein